MVEILIAVGATILGAIAVFFFGYRKAEKDQHVERVEQQLEAVQVAQEVQDEVESLDDAELTERANRWVRNNADE